MTKQVSAYISSDTQANMEKYASAYGIKKAYLIEQAIEHYLQALYELPEEFIVPSKLVLTKDSFQKVIKSIENPPEPTQELLDLIKQNA